MEKNIFAEATRKKVRFVTNVGNISIEDLWDLKLSGSKSDSTDLDKVSQIVLNEQEGSKRKSLVNSEDEKQTYSLIDLKIEILTFIINVKTEEKKAKELETANKEKLEKLKAIRAKKQDASLEGLSLEEIDKEIASLKG